MQSSDQCDGAEFTALTAEERAENSEVLKIQREPIRTRRSRLNLWCRSKRVYARVKMMELELSLEKIARSAKLQECLGHDPDNLHKQHRAETQRDGEQVYRL
jgi:hypothetical protein